MYLFFKHDEGFFVQSKFLGGVFDKINFIMSLSRILSRSCVTRIDDSATNFPLTKVIYSLIMLFVM